MSMLSIVIPVFNNFHFTKSCLDDLFKLPSNHEIVVVDNGSSDKTQNELNKKERENFKYLRNSSNEGFARACNKGYRESCGEYILFLNNDIRVQKDHDRWVDALVDASIDGSIVSPTMGLLDNQLNFICEEDKFIDSPYSYLSGWCLCAKRSTFDKLNGPFCEDYFCYYEDTHLSYQARKLGIKLKQVSIPVVHFKRKTSNLIGKKTEYYLQSRTRFVSCWGL